MTKIQKNRHIQVLPGMDFVVLPFFSSSDGGAASFPCLPRRNLLPGKGGRHAWLIKVAGKRLADFRIVLCGEYSSTCRRVRWRFPQGAAPSCIPSPSFFRTPGQRPARRRGARGSRLFLPPPTARPPETAAPRARKFWRLKSLQPPGITNFGD